LLPSELFMVGNVFLDHLLLVVLLFVVVLFLRVVILVDLLDGFLVLRGF